MYRVWTIILTVLSGYTIHAAAADLGASLAPNLGREVTDYRNTIVSADGSGLPEGSGSVRQGRVLFASRCAACHGADGRQRGNELAGGTGTLDSPRPLRTVGSFWPWATTLYDYIARAMPYNQEKSLSVDEVYALTAYVLFLNHIVEEETVVNQRNLADIEMPNRNGFIELFH